MSRAVCCAVLLCAAGASSLLLTGPRTAVPTRWPRRVAFARCSEDEVVEGTTRALTAAEVEEVGNLAADDEWLGLAMELAIVMRCAVRESVKSSVRDFTGKDDYKLGDLSTEADARIKDAVASLRGKDEYELGDLSAALDEIATEEVCRLTGKESYTPGDLSLEVDSRIKSAVATYCGKEEYEAGDLSREVASRVSKQVTEFTGKGNYEFGDISREIERRRGAWVVDYLGKQDYEFGGAWPPGQAHRCLQTRAHAPSIKRVPWPTLRDPLCPAQTSPRSSSLTSRASPGRTTSSATSPRRRSRPLLARTPMSSET